MVATSHDRGKRRHLSRTFAVAVVLVMTATVGLGSVALAAPPNTQYIPDTCNQGGGNSGQFYADGPPQYWHDATDSGAYDPCLMWTYNETTYTNVTIGNEAYWYNCIGTCTGYFYIDAFVPSIDASTTNAEYQIWEE